MFTFLRNLPERIRFLLYSLFLILLPFFLGKLIVPAFPLVWRQTIQSEIQGIFSQQEDFSKMAIEGQVRKKGVIRFKEEISLSELVKRTGGTEYGYVIPKGEKRVFTDRDVTNSLGQPLDLTPYLKKTVRNFPTRGKWSRNSVYRNKRSLEKKIPYHGRIKDVSEKLGEINERRRSRYR